MKLKERKEQIKNWARENKGKIILGLGAVATVAIVVMVMTKPVTEKSVTETVPEPPIDNDYGRDLEMHFVDPENGEVLWKELCTEEYMNDYKDCGMQYEAVRKLNGIEEV